MALGFGDNISYMGKKPLDSRQLFKTIAEMAAFDENYLPALFMAQNEEDGETYIYKATNDIDPETGKWRKFEGGSGGGSGESVIGATIVAKLGTVVATGEICYLYLDGVVAEQKTASSKVVKFADISKRGTYTVKYGKCEDAEVEITVDDVLDKTVFEVDMLEYIDFEVSGAAGDTVSVTDSSGDSVGSPISLAVTDPNGSFRAVNKGPQELTFTSAIVSGYSKIEEVDMDTEKVAMYPDRALSWYGNNIAGMQFVNKSSSSVTAKTGETYVHIDACHSGYISPKISLKKGDIIKFVGKAAISFTTLSTSFVYLGLYNDYSANDIYKQFVLANTKIPSTTDKMIFVDEDIEAEIGFDGNNFAGISLKELVIEHVRELVDDEKETISFTLHGVVDDEIWIYGAGGKVIDVISFEAGSKSKEVTIDILNGGETLRFESKVGKDIDTDLYFDKSVSIDSSVVDVWLDGYRHLDSSETETITLAMYGANEDKIKIIDDNNEIVNAITFDTGNTSKTVDIDIRKGGETLRFISKVAKDTETGTNDYEKSIAVDGDTTEVKVYPEGALYWYGNTCSDLTSGWIKVSDSPWTNTPVWNSNHVLLEKTVDDYDTAIVTNKKVSLSRYHSIGIVAQIQYGRYGYSRVYVANNHRDEEHTYIGVSYGTYPSLNEPPYKLNSSNNTVFYKNSISSLDSTNICAVSRYATVSLYALWLEE